MRPWICPKCGRVWAGIVEQCRPCNVKIVASPFVSTPRGKS